MVSFIGATEALRETFIVLDLTCHEPMLASGFRGMQRPSGGLSASCTFSNAAFDAEIALQPIPAMHVLDM